MKGSFDATKAANHQAAGKNKPTMKKSKEKKLLEKQRQRYSNISFINPYITSHYIGILNDK